MEDLALYRRAFDHRPLLGTELVEPRREQRLDRGRHGRVRELPRCRPLPIPTNEQPVVDQHREHLFDEERIALSRLRDPLTYLVVAVSLAAVALVACIIPARKASRVDPIVALRYD